MRPWSFSGRWQNFKSAGVALLAGCLTATAQDAVQSALPLAGNISLRHEVRHAIEKGYAYLLSCVQPDGGIYQKEVQSYNTSVVLSALALRNRPQDRVVIQNA